MVSSQPNSIGPDFTLNTTFKFNKHKNSKKQNREKYFYYERKRTGSEFALALGEKKTIFCDRVVVYCSFKNTRKEFF